MPSIDERFAKFHQEHPDVYQQFVEIALDMKRQGVRMYSAHGIAAVIRFFRVTSGKDDQGFKINHNYTAIYARMAIRDHPELDGFFVTRQRKSEAVAP